MMNPDKDNPAQVWAAVLVDEMARTGVSAVVICPGSRSTPLTLAFAAQSQIKVYSLIDERGAAFFALGLALESGRPTAVLCTSGTAAANFFPAVIEAAQSHVPILILTADRPPELRETGANQTINQVDLFGRYVRYAHDLLPPAADPPALLGRYLRTTVDRAAAAAQGPVPGPVHLNIPFRKPLEPQTGQRMPDVSAFARKGNEPFTNIQRSLPQTILPNVNWPQHGLIIAGPRCSGEDFAEAMVTLSQRTGYPIIADALSGMRFGPWVDKTGILNPQVCRAILSGHIPMPDLVLQFGVVPVSNPAIALLKSLPQGTTRVSVQPSGTWHDDTHGLTHLVHADPADFCRKLATLLADHEKDVAWQDRLLQAEAAYWHSVEKTASAIYFEGLVLQDVVESLPDDSMLFVANSLAVRHLDELTRSNNKKVRVFCNRGASGIDGTISSALGVAASGKRPLVLVLGDLAFYHDLTGLLAMHRCGAPAAIVILNNDGGGIFRRLPVSAIDPPFTDLFLTPHGLDFEQAAAMFGAGFTRASDQSGLIDTLREVVGSEAAHIIEQKTNSTVHEQARLKIAADFTKKIEKDIPR